jgi:hypothetical protein
MPEVAHHAPVAAMRGRISEMKHAVLIAKSVDVGQASGRKNEQTED